MVFSLSCACEYGDVVPPLPKAVCDALGKVIGLLVSDMYEGYIVAPEKLERDGVAIPYNAVGLPLRSLEMCAYGSVTYYKVRYSLYVMDESLCGRVVALSQDDGFGSVVGEVTEIEIGGGVFHTFHCALPVVWICFFQLK